MIQQQQQQRQVNCGIGRDSVESYGRRKRSIGGFNETTTTTKQHAKQHRQLASNNDMTLSRELVVLDLTENNNNKDNVPTNSDAPATTTTSTSTSANSNASPMADGETPGQLSDIGHSVPPPPSSLKAASSHSTISISGHEQANNANNQQRDHHQHHSIRSQSRDFNDNLSNKHCLSSQSLSLLICSIGLIFVLYVWLVACMFARRDSKISHIKQQFY